VVPQARAGIPARLVLVQSLSDLGAGDTVKKIFFPKTEEPRVPQNITEALWSLQPYASQIANEIPLPSKVRLAGIQVGLGTDSKTPGIQLSYLADEILSADAAEMTIAWIRRYSGLPDRAVSLEWIPAIISATLGRNELLSESARLQISEVSKALKRFPHLVADFELPPGLSERRSGKLYDILETLVPEILEKDKCFLKTSDTNSKDLTVRVKSQDQNKSNLIPVHPYPENHP
jgi:hypothetical protein